MKPGKYYQFTNKTIVLCTEDNLEVFSGIVVKVGKKDKHKHHKIGYHCTNWNSDADWKKINIKKIKIKLW